MEEIAKVIKVNRDTLTARIERHSACGKCGMCGLTPDSKYIDILFKNTVEAKVGDSVVISVSGENITKFTLLVYLLPLVVGFILFAIGFWALALPDWASILVFLAGIAVGFTIVHFVDKKNRHKWKGIPQLLSLVKNDIIISEGEEKNE